MTQRRKTAAETYREDYLLNDLEYRPDFPGLLVHSFCHSFLKPSWQTHRPPMPYVIVAMILSGENIYLTDDGDRVRHRESHFSIADLNVVQKNTHKLKNTLERYFILLRVNRFLRELLQSLFPAGLPQFMPSHPERLKRAFEDVRRELRKKNRTDHAQLGGMVFRLLSEAASQLPAPERKPASLVNALSYIDNRFCDRQLTRQEIASAAGISMALLDKLFRDHMSTTVNHFVTGLRLEKAKKLLTHSTLPVGEIAARCGFSYRYYFAKVFRTETGLAPLKYRSASRRNAAPE